MEEQTSLSFIPGLRDKSAGDHTKSWRVSPASIMNWHTLFKEEHQVGDCVFAYFNSNKQTLRVYKAFPIAGPKFGLILGFVKAIVVKVNKGGEGSLL